MMVLSFHGVTKLEITDTTPVIPNGMKTPSSHGRFLEVTTESGEKYKIGLFGKFAGDLRLNVEADEAFVKDFMGPLPQDPGELPGCVAGEQPPQYPTHDLGGEG